MNKSDHSIQQNTIVIHQSNQLYNKTVDEATLHFNIFIILRLYENNIVKLS